MGRSSNATGGHLMLTRLSPPWKKMSNYLISLAHPTRFERVTFAFGAI